MSSTGRGAQREDFDKYYTPEWFADEGIKVVQRFFASDSAIKILEPSCGGGVFVTKLKAAFPASDIVYSDLMPDEDFPAPQMDFFDRDEEGTYDLIITNPPYNVAEDFAKHALKLLKPGGKLVLLLRVNFFAGQRRAAWQLVNPAEECHVTVRRPKFKGKGTDSTEYSYFVWEKGLVPEFTRTYLLDTRTGRYRV